jgi:hypothetical protein
VTKDLREIAPFPRNSLHAQPGKLGYTGERLNPSIDVVCTDTEAVADIDPRQQVGADTPSLPCSQSGFRKERIGSDISHHLRDLAESTYVNVGGSFMEVSRPPKK